MRTRGSERAQESDDREGTQTIPKTGSSLATGLRGGRVARGWESGFRRAFLRARRRSARKRRSRASERDPLDSDLTASAVSALLDSLARIYE